MAARSVRRSASEIGSRGKAAPLGYAFVETRPQRVARKKRSEERCATKLGTGCDGREWLGGDGRSQVEVESTQDREVVTSGGTRPLEAESDRLVPDHSKRKATGWIWAGGERTMA